ncbi:hypothetical protein ACP4OV_022751 [Aristida adscensionis]
MEEKKPSEKIKEGGSTEDGNNEEDDLGFPGFRFHPTDLELVGFYLKRKVEKKGFSIEIIKEIDIYKYDPWDLPNEAPRHVAQGAGDKEWYFFCLRGRKYRNSIRPNRVTGSGFWKATGIDKPIHAGAGAGECVGLKKSLVYYRGSAGRGTKTDWMMHEFRLPNSSPSDLQDAEIWTICRIFKRTISYNRRCQQQQQQQKQQHQEHSKNRSYQHQQQLEYYYDYHYHHHRQYGGGASMANSFELSDASDAADCRRAAAAHATHSQPFLLHGFHGVSSAAAAAEAVTTVQTTTAPVETMGAPLPSVASGWSGMTTMSFRPDGGGGGGGWDELGRIMEISTDATAFL